MPSETVKKWMVKEEAKEAMDLTKKNRAKLLPLLDNGSG
jgi:hypothetical protein